MSARFTGEGLKTECLRVHRAKPGIVSSDSTLVARFIFSSHMMLYRWSFLCRGNRKGPRERGNGLMWSDKAGQWTGQQRSQEGEWLRLGALVGLSGEAGECWV